MIKFLFQPPCHGRDSDYEGLIRAADAGSEIDFDNYRIYTNLLEESSDEDSDDSDFVKDTRKEIDEKLPR